MEYKVDISKPPIFPPRVQKIEQFFAEVETQESLERTAKWNLYIKEYSKALSESQNEVHN